MEDSARLHIKMCENRTDASELTKNKPEAQTTKTCQQAYKLKFCESRNR